MYSLKTCRIEFLLHDMRYTSSSCVVEGKGFEKIRSGAVGWSQRGGGIRRSGVKGQDRMTFTPREAKH